MEPIQKTDDRGEPPAGNLELKWQRLIDDIALLVVRQFRRNDQTETSTKGEETASQFQSG